MFVLSKPFQPILVFAGKATSLPESGAPKSHLKRFVALALVVPVL